MSQNSNNIVVKSTLPRTASAEDKLNEIINQLQKKYQGRTVYFLSEIKKENREVNFDTVGKWAKEAKNVTLTDYLVSKGILTPAQYFDIVENDISVEDLKGKKCCAFCYDGSISTSLQDNLSKCGAIIVPHDSNKIDYVCGAGLDKVLKIPPDNRKEVYSLFNRRDNGELKFEVVAYGFQYKVEAYIKSLMLTQEERTALGISIYNQPQELFYDYGYTFKNNINPKDIPQYDASKHYWSLNYFYDWYGASGGEIRGTLDSYCTIDCEDSADKIKRNFSVFSDLCNRIEDKQIQSYISRKAHTLKNESKKSMILASLGYISDFEGCWCIVLNAGKGDTFTIKLQKIKMLSHWDDFDYALNKLEENGIPATLCSIIEGHINDYAFRNMPGYIWIDNPLGVIPQGAFANDPSIKYVEMSDNVNKIDFNAFKNCENLESVKIGGAVEEINSAAFSNCCNLKNVIIPSSVKVIGHGCFKDCLNLSEVSFEGESRCETIEMNAFSGCKLLSSITIPPSIKTIGEKAFCDCSSLVSIKFNAQSECSSIHSRAFSGCLSLSDINVPDSVLIYENAFEKCDLLKEKLVSQNSDGVLAAAILTPPLTEAACRNIFNYESNYYTIIITKFKSTDSIVEIPATIGNSVVGKIGKNAFANSLVTEITIPKTVYDIAASAFDNCKNLKRVYMHADIDEFGNWFDNCSELTELFISKKIEKIAEKALCGCLKLDKISIDPQNKHLMVIDNAIYSDDGKTLLRCLPGIAQSVFHVPMGVTKIANSAFYGCVNLTSIILPNSVNTIGSSAFEGCVKLTDVMIPNSVIKVGFSLFKGCASLTNVTIPFSIERIGDWMFSGCSSIKEITYTGTHEQWNRIYSSIYKNPAPLPFVIHYSDDSDAL